MALISSLILDAVRANRAQALAAQGRARQAAHVRNLLGTAPVMEDMGGRMGPPATLQAGTGLLANPTDLATQLRFGGGLMQLPATASQGSQFMQSALANARAIEEGARDRDLRAQLQREGFAQDESQFQRRFDRDEFWKRRADARAEEQAQRGYLVGDLPTGYVPDFDPETQTWGARAVRGTPDYRKGLERLSEIEGDLQTIDQIIQLVRETGSEAWGETRGELDALVGRVHTGLLRELDLGAPQAGDMALVERLFRDPAGLTGTFTGKGTLLRNMETAREQFRQTMLRERQQYRRWGGDFNRFFVRNGVPTTFAGNQWRPPGVPLPPGSGSPSGSRVQAVAAPPRPGPPVRPPVPGRSAEATAAATQEWLRNLP